MLLFGKSGRNNKYRYNILGILFRQKKKTAYKINFTTQVVSKMWGISEDNNVALFMCVCEREREGEGEG